MQKRTELIHILIYISCNIYIYSQLMCVLPGYQSTSAAFSWLREHLFPLLEYYIAGHYIISFRQEIQHKLFRIQISPITALPFEIAVILLLEFHVQKRQDLSNNIVNINWIMKFIDLLSTSK